MKTFRHYAGDAHFNSKNVAVYSDENNNRILVAENLKTGEELAAKTVTAEEYSNLRDEWEDGCISQDDCNITIRALEFVCE